jgi:hypothetical protein
MGKNEKRRLLVESGLCGYCAKPRRFFKWLCDDCATKHRLKQRAKAFNDSLSICERCERRIRTTYSIIDGDVVCVDCLTVTQPLKT